MTKPDMRIKMGSACFSGIKDLDENKRIDESQIKDICAYIDERYDCADFRWYALYVPYIYSPSKRRDSTDNEKTVLVQVLDG